MGGRRMLILLVGVVVLLGGTLLVLFMFRPRDGAGVAEPTATPEFAKIVMAVQDVPLGQVVMSDSLKVFNWPISQIPFPPGAYSDIPLVVGRYAAVDIPAGVPILDAFVVDSYVELLQRAKSDISKGIPTGKVAVALPISRLSSVAYALQAGDRVDVLASFWMIDLDEEFQTKLINNFTLAVPTGDGVVFYATQPGGRDRNPVLGFPAIEHPPEAQRPRLVAQLTVQNVQVLGVGDWITQRQPAKEEAPQPTARPNQPTPTAVAPTFPDIVTVVVDPQDALVLKFLRESGAVIDLALRSFEDKTQTFTTESVTLQYMLARFEIAQPPKLPYGLEVVATPAPE